MMKRSVALAVAAALLAACAHKDKDAPLAFVPADTPYVVANLKVPDDATRQALLDQADAQLPAQLQQLRSAADRMAESDPATARLLRALIAELDGKSIEAFAKNAGLDLKGHSAFYGLGLAPVMRFELSDPAAFEAFVGRLETAYGSKFDTAKIGNQNYRLHVSPETGTEVLLAVVGKQAVAAVLPSGAAQPLLRAALGLDRPQKSLQDDDRLEKLAKAKGYKQWLVGDLDLTRILPLAFGGTDPLVTAMAEAHAKAESAKTGEPVANQLKVPASCQTDAARIAARAPRLSFGYTELDPKHQSARVDLALADDISKAFSGLQVKLPGLGAAAAAAPFDFSLAMPVAQLRTFWSAQAEAVAAKPFTCPALTDLNGTFAKLGPAMQKAAIPPFGDLLGIHMALDRFDTSGKKAIPDFSGRLILGTSNPAGLLAMGQMMTPALSKMKLTADGKPVALPANLSAMFGQPAWLAMGDNALALGIGAGQDAKLAAALKEAGGDSGQMMRMHLSGEMYLNWLTLMQQKADSLLAASAALGGDDEAKADASERARQQALSKARFDAMRSQAARIKTVSGEVHVDSDGMVITSQTELK